VLAKELSEVSKVITIAITIFHLLCDLKLRSLKRLKSALTLWARQLVCAAHLQIEVKHEVRRELPIDSRCRFNTAAIFANEATIDQKHNTAVGVDEATLGPVILDGQSALFVSIADGDHRVDRHK